MKTLALRLAALGLGAALALSACAPTTMTEQEQQALERHRVQIQSQASTPAPTPERIHTADALVQETAAANQMPPPPMQPGALPSVKMAAPTGKPMLVHPDRARGFVPPMADTERYAKIDDNPVKQVAEAPVSTFSIDVDTGSYANVRRFLNGGRLPPKDAVRIEEMVNYFPYHYAHPKGDAPFAVHLAAAPAPWNAEHVLLRVGIQGADIAKQTLPPVNLVFLVDVSGSMDSPDKLPLLQSALKLLVRQMRAQDKISLVTYAGQTAVVLSGASGADHDGIATAIDRLGAGGSTAGAAGIELAYREARRHFVKNGINRILLATDGDFNVGIVDFGQLKGMIERERRSGVSFSTLGFGTGNYNDQLMEQLADVGNGAYSYIDSLMEGKKVLVNEMTSTLATIAQDVKIQIEFNPAAVAEYRLIGYENRLLQREDFNNDQVDAGDVGAGHTVTALYELTPVGAKPSVDPLRYAAKTAATKTLPANELAFLKLRWKKPGQAQSRLIEIPVPKGLEQPMDKADADFHLAASVAGFGQLLRGSPYLGGWSWKDAQKLAAADTLSAGDPAAPYRTELVQLIEMAETLSVKEAQAK